MSDPTTAEEPDLSSLASSPGSKRKREMDSPGSQRAKRAAPAAAMTADTAAFIESAIEATHAAAANGVNVADFNALQQAAAADHTDASDPSNATSTAQAALGMYPTLHVPSSTEEQFAAQAAADGEHQSDASFNPEIAQSDIMDPSAVTQQPAANGVQPPAQRYSASSATSNPKPTVGSEEWHKMRKDNHKEVERRRRETINEGINELAKIVPGSEKNKGSILQRAVSFISQLKENEQQNIEKWTLEKLLTEQAITELSASNDKLKQECERLYRELETWKRVAQNAGLEPPQPKEEPNSGAASS
ncbi:Helix-loop-helix protein that binds the motif CACRTG [Metarhizium album ARSEF 1941]|uniref:Helix-loop-helix protein that binds the motif CACRTG n=1 Tax=Metarhizium album (strain ARSEF 1941) TaxID=1081103 RepID=A0A0B2X5T0_METAS|nr:Helix-loop-helix protein that binds the motif CACRTG [Metarhizium album ARSEF 1941]KHO00666.1 Helix-loop-helix protein that binds the motif CACRTG [Metarhizium album ARSEF 1941]